MKKILGLICLSAMPFLFACQEEEKTTLSGLKPSDFQMEINGKPNQLYVLKNAGGMEVCMTNFGARIVSIWVPDNQGTFADVVLGFDSIGGYLNHSTDFGAFIGRYGNRINQGKFTLDGQTYQLDTNNFGHSLHGGSKGFQYRMFDIDQIDDQTLVVRYVAEDGEMGFPGELTSKATYHLTDDNAIDIQYEAVTDKPTIINLTNHSYFNLTGNPEETVLNHTLLVDADAYTPVDETFMTTGEIATVDQTPMDFRTSTRIGDRIDQFDFEQLKNGNGYDHNWVLNTSGDVSKPAAIAIDPVSGRSLTVFTDEPGIQVYSGNFLDGTVTGKKGIVYQQRVGLCLETQHHPDSPNKADWPSVVLRPGETYTSRCIYQFGVVK
ncbi:MAG TPA: aldose epimerase family protein [Bacteroidales bacterium]|jgi:aldose 1-epimerase|nr:aldose epimerase family protein [Bacteroidales bacterium]